MNNWFADRIRKFRKLHGLSLHELAFLIGISYQNLRNWEIGKAKCSAEFVVARLFDLCDKEGLEFVFGNGNGKTRDEANGK